MKTLHLRRGEAVSMYGRDGHIVAVGKGVVFVLFDGDRQANTFVISQLASMVDDGTAKLGNYGETAGS